MGVRKSDVPYGDQEWYKRADGRVQFQAREGVTELQVEFIDWLLDPSKDKGTQLAWSEAHGISMRSLQVWKKDKRFIDEWEKRAAEAYGGMERLQKILDTLYETAIDKGDVKAINLYLQYVDRYTPRKVVVKEGTSVQDLSDEELAQLGENITRLRKEA